MTTSHLSSQITRTPRIFDSSRAADAAPLIDGFDPAVAALIQGAVSAAPYLMGLLEREAEWLRGAVEDPDTAVDAVIAGAA